MLLLLLDQLEQIHQFILYVHMPLSSKRWEQKRRRTFKTLGIQLTAAGSRVLPMFTPEIYQTKVPKRKLNPG